jgi:hypothetical protein
MTCVARAPSYSYGANTLPTHCYASFAGPNFLRGVVGEILAAPLRAEQTLRAAWMGGRAQCNGCDYLGNNYL